MSKRKHISQRDTNDISNHRLPDTIDVLNDTRTYHPERPRQSSQVTFSTINQAISSLRPRSNIHGRILRNFKQTIYPVKKYDFFNPGHIAFYPRETLVCLRRKLRREVIFATGKSGKGKRQRKKQYKPDSAIKCRR